MDIVFSFEFQDTGYEIQDIRFEVYFFEKLIDVRKSQRDDLVKDRIKSYQQKY